MTNAVSGNLAHGTRGLASKAMTDYRDLSAAVIAALVAAILLRLATVVAQPSATHAVLAVLGTVAIVAGYLLIGRSTAPPEWKLATVVGAAILAALGFRLLTMLLV
jgi:hypothetical protein